MKFEDILAVSGKPGLYHLEAQGRGGIIISGLSDSKKIQIPASAQVSALRDISIYTYEEEVPLLDVFLKMSEQEQVPGHKESGNVLKAFFEKVLPNYDEERVYTSDMKKMVQWFNQLKAEDKLDILKEAKAQEQEEEVKK